MENDFFDDAIRKRMEEMEQTLDNSSWFEFQKKMKETSSVENEELFDQSVKEKIEGHSSEFQKEHWNLMLDRIKKEFSIRGRLVNYKVFEVSLMLLVIFTISQFFLTNPQVNLKKFDLSGIHFFNKKDKDQTIKSNSILKNSTDQIPQAVIEQNDAKTIDLLIAKTENAWAFDAPINKSANSFTTDYLPKLNSSVLITTPPSYIYEHLSSRKSNVPLLAFASSLNISDLELENNKLNAQAPKMERIKKRSIFRFGMMTQLDFNHIQTPKDEHFELPSYHQVIAGYSAGFTTGWKLGDFEIETGGIYSTKSYAPRDISEFLPNPSTSGLLQVKLDQIQMNTVELPITLRKFWVNEGKWRFYGQAGGSMHMAIQANYDLFPANIQNLGIQSREGNAPKIQEKKFANGLLEGGNLKENSYFTANLGVGFERYFTGRWSFYIQPKSQLHLFSRYDDGIGPNRDRISNFSIETGARINLY